jgi:hypothetical protein
LAGTFAISVIAPVHGLAHDTNTLGWRSLVEIDSSKRNVVFSFSLLRLRVRSSTLSPFANCHIGTVGFGLSERISLDTVVMQTHISHDLHEVFAR